MFTALADLFCPIAELQRNMHLLNRSQVVLLQGTEGEQSAGEKERKEIIIKKRRKIKKERRIKKERIKERRTGNNKKKKKKRGWECGGGSE